MADQLREAREGLIQSLGRVSAFWGFSKIVGQLYGLLYLSPAPLSLDDMAVALGASKGNVSINVRLLERLGMVRKVWQRGERKDYYEAETDFWQIVKDILREREKKEFDQALRSVSDCLRLAAEVTGRTGAGTPIRAEAAFVEGRLRRMEEFFKLIDGFVHSVLVLEDLRFPPPFGSGRGGADPAGTPTR
ncbi:MAG: hypothetical protein HYX94_00320 [Chloroflexi bacterium]|nr:hypothetical protein [Chloroflexota bacterium]